MIPQPRQDHHAFEAMMRRHNGRLFRVARSILRNDADAEAAVLLKIFQSHLADYQADKPAAEKLLAVGDTKRNEKLDASELAAYTMVANLILNLDETITKN